MQLFVKQVVIELPRLFIQTLMYGVVAYAIIGLNGQLLSSSRTSSVPLLYGMTTDAVTPNHDIAAIISSAFDTIWNFFSGFHHSKNIWWTYRISSKFGDIQIKLDVNRTMEQFIWSYFRFRHDFVEYVAVTIVGIVVRRLHFFLSQSGHVTFRQDRT